MSALEFIQSQYTAAIAGGIGGVVTAWLSQKVLNKRGTVSYAVNHQRIAIASEDKIFGTVAVTWNSKPANNLYLSTVELRNESMNDYENVIVRAYTNNTRLLTEQAGMLDGPHIIEWSDKFKTQLHLGDGKTATDEQLELYYGQREYIIPVLNRGQGVRITYLNSALDINVQPVILLGMEQKGVKLKHSVPQAEVLGVPTPLASLVGIIIGTLFVAALVWKVPNQIAVGFLSLLYGLGAQLPGAYVVKLIRYLREVVGG